MDFKVTEKRVMFVHNVDSVQDAIKTAYENAYYRDDKTVYRLEITVEPDHGQEEDISE